ncbi:SusC/RagA family TonB-linked outer membrane protein [Maribacter polysaccharolyticus]|uniref:SusC/RagA family TonB-linked outer membrane protein n=1 Tax=Maribacter polysaccharolyticus TaxID=3020831 RepID=UPI00237EEB69|nr:TonB-dependent receptor [Maribacter polysaccharolyticus]MDE3741763.1 TonB-dependent receptor [Maribacter polysaccharolyticus]
MKISFVLVIVALLNPVFASTARAQKLEHVTIDLSVKNASIEEVIGDIEKQTSFNFVYGRSISRLANRYSFDYNNVSLKSILELLAKDAGLAFRRIDGNISVDRRPKAVEKVTEVIFQQIKGSVVDENGNPLPAASVTEKGTSNGTATDFDGNFTMVVGPDAILEVSFIGYETKYVTVGSQTTLKIQLQPSSSNLDEVVVVGYGTLAKKNITGAIATVAPEEIVSQPKANVVEMLDGRLPGVQVMSDNSPGGGTSIRIRGFSTINSNDPLVIIDGVPASNGLNGVNPVDIETIQVLKDAASASIYGSRAANGVVIITTKKGAKTGGDYVVSFDSYAGLQSNYNVPRMLSAQEYGDLLWQATINDGGTPSNDIYGDDPTQAVIPEWLNDEQTLPSDDVDWVKEIMQTAAIQSYNVSLAKGDEKGQQLFSLGYFNQEGLLKYTGFERYSARFNSSFNIGDFLVIGENFTANYKEQVAASTNSALGGIVLNAMQFPSIVPVKDINGEFGGNPLNDISNPLGDLYRNKDNKQKRIQALGNIYASLFIKDFTFKTSFGLDYQNYNLRDFSPTYDEIIPSNNTSSLTTYNSFNYQFSFTNTLNYKKDFGLHNLDVLLGQEAIEYNYEGFDASIDDFLYEDTNYRYLSYGTENMLNSGSASGWALNSYFGRLNYNYDEKYLFTASVRRDGSSRFSGDNKWGTFPAFSMGWRLDREGFFNNDGLLTSAMIRGSWGQTGNQEISSYATVDSYRNNNANSNYAIDGAQESVSVGLTQSRIPNADLKWETTTQTSIGVDLGFLENKLGVTADYYIKKTKDILVYSTVPLTYGGTNDGQWVNDGRMKNSGFELNVNYADRAGDFGYDVGLNLTGSRNELTELSTSDYLGIPSSSLHSVNFDQEISRSAVGQPLASFFGYVAEGLFQNQAEIDNYGLQPNAQPGDIRFKDVDGDGDVDADDRTFIGSPHPDLLLGLNVKLNYKKFDLSLFFSGSFGNDIYNFTKFKNHFFNQAAYNKQNILVDAWTESNTDSSIPRLSLDDANNNIRQSTYYVENGSYVRLNNLQLGYNFDKDQLSGVQLRIYLQGSNLFTITDYSGMNPQVGLQNYSGSNRNLDIGIDRGLYPPSRTFVIGCNLKL